MDSLFAPIFQAFTTIVSYLLILIQFQLARTRHLNHNTGNILNFF